MMVEKQSSKAHIQKMINWIGKGRKMSDGTELSQIGSIENGDFFLFYPNGEVRLLLGWSIVKDRGKMWVKIYKFMLVDLGNDNIGKHDNRTVGFTNWEENIKRNFEAYTIDESPGLYYRRIKYKLSENEKSELLAGGEKWNL